MRNEIVEWATSIPPVTRFFFFGTLLLSALAPMVLPRRVLSLFLLESGAIMKLEIWRFITAALFYGGPSFALLSHLFMLYSYGRRLEETNFAGRRADYVFAITMLLAVISAVSFFFNLRITGSSLTQAIIYIWSQLNRDVIVTFFFGINFKAALLPWAFIAFDILTGVSPLSSFIGIVAGHAYYFTTFEWPTSSGRPPIFQTPGIFRDIFGADDRPPTVQSADGAPPSPPTGSGSTRQWATGPSRRI
ncbi:hypothetical protein H696_02730 [Fonticula alba]|uniref:Derlin n=1 Tax=Fonticula alba TaxID=691883 RepID=A0A058Z7X4_FONAL|nr:hypothetical protein H696_02730 [Fonticula alba]KCV70394.1 hypothetical protein H696_02730 [Fonticula alba]|eukprot:XP_009494910.1 hypothetical protein H696_02730 [Fonticula alba]